MSKESKNPNCHNCKFAGNKFKILGLTHLHCEDKELYSKEAWENEEFNEYDTLRVWWDKCKKHEFIKD